MNLSSRTWPSIFLVVGVTLWYPAYVAPFSVLDCTNVPTVVTGVKSRGPPRSRLSVTTVILSEKNTANDEYDDFYDDFDPSDYETYYQGSQRSFDEDEYTRDISVDNSDVDVGLVTTLIAERAELRKTRQYDKADKIVEELLENHGVLVRDKDKKWRTGCFPSMVDSNWLYASSKQNGSGKKRKDLGPNGHDYVYASDAGPSIASISEDRINELLAKMLSCKFSRNYDGADEIQMQLLSAGVVIDGKARKWRADGQSFSNFAPNEYQMSPHAYDVSSHLIEIEELIRERALARAERLFKRSDEIRDELLKRFDVRINDKLLLWSVGGEQTWGKSYEPYTMSDRSQAPSDIELIEKLVKERDIARGNREFGKADKIRTQLLDINVTVDDKKRIWYVSKVPKTSRRNILNSKDLSPYIRRGGEERIPDDDIRKIEDLVNERDEHKRRKRYRNADAIRSQLMKEYGVKVDDNTREWFPVGNEYSMAKSTDEMDEKIRSEVELKIQNRILARSERDYKKADAIKKELFEVYNVAIDDAMKEWSVVRKGKSSV
mmetsp:Transcript_33190/g.78399  ORF Transcript_33190/g.78399 Transcript_33190/m.78399 type:complete len:548 (-) Transcript_33190:1772-3415(-)|eukprot:CAMPEP_0172404828 /NCGR_PEP_ID=MMETSP1061-20121228/64641_1 /TAXON_ID=37318 /ORGANISM="Pseudo-nitzschia pungens, Strain cf. pungens" /LENGTH=547 /DNA_ID=CAMNT_0013139793 /DNA_START=40 /DNA_END=1683 /DNA_ORIENTATION=+